MSALQGQRAHVEIVNSSESGFIVANAVMQTSRDYLRYLSTTRWHVSRKNGLGIGSEPGRLGSALALMQWMIMCWQTLCRV